MIVMIMIIVPILLKLIISPSNVACLAAAARLPRCRSWR